MKKLVTALIVILPLLLLIAIFAVTNIAKIAANVRATGIVIENKGEDGVFTFDIFSNRTPIEEWELGVHVVPMAANDVGYSLSVTDAETGEASDIVTLRDDGFFELHDVGVVKLTFTSNDGGYTDSVLFNVIASGVLDFTPVISDVSGNKYPLEKGEKTDYAVTLSSGAYELSNDFYPAGLTSSDVYYESSNDSVLSMSAVSGKFNAIFSGEAIVTVRVAGVLPKTIAVSVTMADEVTVNGVAASAHPILSHGVNADAFSFFVETREKVSADSLRLEGEKLKDFEVEPLDAEGELASTFLFKATLDALVTGNANLEYTLFACGRSYEFTVAFSDYVFTIYSSLNTSNSGELLMFNGETTRFSVESEPSNPLLRYEWSLDGGSVAQIVTQNGSVVELKALSMGEATLRVNWFTDGENGVTSEGVIERTLKVINGVSAMLFEEKAKDWGLGEQAVASMNFVNGTPTKAKYIVNFMSYGRNDGPSAPLEDFDFTAEDPSIIQVGADADGVFVQVLGSGEAKITASWKYGERFGISPVSFSFKAVDGVFVEDDKQLRAAMNASLPVVLEKDIYLGESLFNVSSTGERTPKYDAEVARNKLLAETSEIETTWDWKYYENVGFEKPKVRYCLEFTADVYGNGNSINAEYITNMLFNPPTLYKFAVFNGPLDFVATDSTGPKLAAVKGQDNIVFLQRTDGLTIDNVILKGCDTESLYDLHPDGTQSIDLAYLNAMGTTLEVMADTTVTNSRIMNGRTCVRAFGRYGVEENSPVQPEKERIHLTIDNCKLQNGREFLLKIGTNRFLRGSEEAPSPALVDGSGKPYVAINEPNSPVTDEQMLKDEYFLENLMLTDVTIKDSTLSSSGLFAVGVESHFSGVMLAGNDDIKAFEGWHDLAATSYPAVLRLVGNVVIDDWKDIANVNSSTLIETEVSSEGQSFLSLNIDAMLKHVRDKGGEEYADIIVRRGEKNYVHGGIAFYGGGRNYSVIDLSRCTSEALKQYKINLSVLQDSDDITLSMQGSMLPMAAGVNDFRFFMLPGSSYKG